MKWACSSVYLHVTLISFSPKYFIKLQSMPQYYCFEKLPNILHDEATDWSIKLVHK